MAKPKWATPDRQTHLVELFLRLSNRCLYGHSTCPDPTHYACFTPKVQHVADAVQVACKDNDGNPLLDSKGNRLYLTLYKHRKAVTYTLKFARLYDAVSEQIIADWKADDRAQRQADWREEQRAIHSLSERRYPVKGEFNAIAKDIFYASQPLYYLTGLGVSGLTCKPFARVRLPSGFVHLFVDLGDSLKGLSKSKRRKAIRYGKALPQQTQEEIAHKCRLAVRHYLTKG